MDKNKLMVFNENIDYLFHANIVECDMVAASVSVCERYKLLDSTTIEWLKLLPKEKRTIEMGMIQKNQSFSEKMINGILETRLEFIEENNIKDEDILSLHSDALFINMKHEIKDNIGGVEFKLKNRYLGYMKYDKRIEMFYTGDVIDFKQIPIDLIHQHTLGINKYLLNIFNKIDNYDETILDYITKFNTRYLQNKLPDYYYNSFGKVGAFKIENLQLFGYIANVVLKEMRDWK